MDLRRNIFEVITDRIREELGPLNTNWFEELTLQTKVSLGDGDDSVTEQEKHLSTVTSCRSFETPVEKNSLDSQLFSTPKMFRHGRQQSETEDEEPFPPEQGVIEMTWTDTSPCLFGTSKDSTRINKTCRSRQPQQHSFELLDTPKKSAVPTPQRIADSLGAQIDPDMSWTSSLNTPPDMTPTIILDKTEDMTCPVSLSADREVILVRKLFPSTSNVFGSRGLSSENNDEPRAQHNGVNLHMPGLVNGSLSSQDASRKDSSSRWKQALPDATEDGEVCGTVANVLDGAEEVLSMFFSNSSAALRRVKTKDRIKRKSSLKKEPTPPTHTTVISTSKNDESSEIAGEDEKIVVTSVSLDIKSDVKTGDNGTTQWTPISLADISDGDLDTCSHHRDSSTENVLVAPNKSTGDQRLGGSAVETSQELTFTRRNRKFVYRAQNPHPSVTQKSCALPGTSLSGDNPLMKQRESAEYNDVNKNTFNWKHKPIQQECATEENIVSPGHTRQPQDNDLNDMSQLCRAFAQDLSQIVDSTGEISRVKLGTTQNELSASACLSALRQRSKKQLLIRNKSGQKRETPHDSDNGFSNEKHIPTWQLSNRANTTKMEKTVCVSGFLSTCADVTQPTESSSLQLSSEKPPGNIQPYSAFQTGYNRNKSLLSNQRCVDVQGPLTASQRADVSELCSLLEDADSQFEFTQFKPTAKPLNFNVLADIPPHHSSDKELDPNFLTGIDFDDSFSSDAEKQSVKMVTPDKVTSPHVKIVCKASSTKIKLKGTSFYSSEKHKEDGPHSISMARALFNDCKEKMDETNISHASYSLQNVCGFSTARHVSDEALLKVTSILNDCNELENEHSEAKKHIRATAYSTKVKVKGTPFCNSAEKHKEDGPHSSPKNKAVISSDLLTNTTLRNNLLEPKTSTSETAKSDNNGLKFGGGFKTAGGNVLRVSEKCLSKARVLFADIEENQEMNTQRFVNGSDVEQVGLLPVEHGGNVDSNVEQINRIDGNTVNNSEIGNGFVGSTFTANQNRSSKKKIESGTLNITRCHGFVNKSDLKVLPDEHTEKTNGLVENVDLSHSREHSGGFQMASGKGVSISAKAIQLATGVFKDCDVAESLGCASEKLDRDWAEAETGSANIERNNCGFSTAQRKGKVSEKATVARAPLNDCKEKTDETNISHASYSLQNVCRFSTASGKKVAVSDEALLKATSILNECNEFENEHSEAKKQIGAESLHTDLIQAPPQKHNGFKTASGKGVTISAKALNEATAVFKDCDSDIGSVHVEEAKREKSSDAKPDDAHKRAEESRCAFEPAGGKKVHISEKDNSGARTFLNKPGSEVSTTDSKSSLVASRSSSHNQRKICGKGGSVSTNATEKAYLTDGSRYPLPCEDDSGVKQQLTTRPNNSDSDLSRTGSSCMFSTASGKTVSVSDKALQKAKSLLDEHAVIEDAVTEDAVIKHTDSDLSRPGSSCMFSTASGKTVSVSGKALQKAKFLLDEPAVIEHAIIEHTDSNLRTGSSCAFSTASGKTVSVSDNALQKAKSLLDEHAAVEDAVTEHSVIQRTEPENNNRVDLAKKTSAQNAGASACSNPGKGSSFGFSTASGHGVSVSDKSLKEAFEKFKDCDDETLTGGNDHHQRLGDKKSLETPSAPCMCDQRVLAKAGTPENRDVIHTSGGLTHRSPRAHQKGSSLNFESLGLSGCSVTQQRYFAQEAMDCAKALLEDEDLARESPPGTSVETPIVQAANPVCSKEPSEMRKGIGKRSAEDEDMKEQLPLKRRLLAEFDRTLDCKRQSTLTPAKTSSHGTLKDRRVFKYNVSLQPNVTRPYRDKNSSVDLRLNKTEAQNIVADSTPGDGKPANPKMELFVPPFTKTVNPEMQKSGVRQDKIRRPAVYVPPFRKQNSVITESVTPQRSDKTTPLNSLVETPDHHQTSTPLSLAEKNHVSRVTESDSNVKVDVMKSDVEKGDSGNDGGHDLAVEPKGNNATADGSAPGLSPTDSTDINQNLHCLQLARDMQDMRIRKKKRQTIRPLPGSLFLAKTSGVTRVSLREAVSGNYPVQHTRKQLYAYGVHEHVSQVSSGNAESFRFHCQHFFKQEAFVDGGGVQLADGGWLICQNNGTAGKEEFYRALCDTPGVDPKLISEAWGYNHYRWVVWKQASMERCFPEVMGSLCLTPEQVLLQLKYRYDVEVDHTRRSALRKIMERDDTAAKTMVLCVCGVVTLGQNLTRPSRNETKTPQGADSKVEPCIGVIWLTDGWYAVRAQVDVPLTAMLHKGRLAIGGKVMIHGAELVGSQDACSPLEAPESLMLKIWANGTRPARWDARLGFHSDPRPFLLPLSSLYSSGGLVGAVDIVVLRSYPTQWMEKKPGGGFVFRNVRSEDRESRRHSDSLEKLYARVQAQFEKEEDGVNKARERRTVRRKDVETLQDGEELHEAVENDPVSMEGLLSTQQMETLARYRCSLGERRQAELKERFCRALETPQEGVGSCPAREVTPVWKLCISDARDQQGRNVYQLNVWRPSTDLQSLLREGCRYRACNLSISEGKKQAGVASIQLTATKKTHFQDIKASPEQMHFQARVSASFHSLRDPNFHPVCGEVDLVGYVVSINDRQGSSPVVHLVDGKLDFVKVRFSNSLAHLSLEDLVKPLALLALSNLQLRPQPPALLPVLYAGDLALFSAKPKEPHLQEAFAKLRVFTQGQEHFFSSAEERLSDLVQSDGLSSFSSPVLPPRTPGWNGEAKQGGRPNVTPQQPLRSLGSCSTPMTRNNPPKPASCSANKDPKSLKRKRGLDYLSCIPSPPPLCPLGTMTSPCVSKTFNPPRRSETPRSLKTVQTPAPRPPPRPVPRPVEDEWVEDEELATIDTQDLHDDGAV